MKNRILLLDLVLMILVCLGPIPSPVCAQGKTMTIEGIPSNRPGMVTCIVCRLEYGSDSFEVKLLDPNTSSFKVYGDVSRPGFTITPASIVFDAGAAAKSVASELGDGLGDGGVQNISQYYDQGAGTKFLPVIVMTHSSKVPVQITNTCTNRDTWQPVRFGMTGSDNVVTSTFGNPSSTVTGELQFRVPGAAPAEASQTTASQSSSSQKSGWSGYHDGYGGGDNDDEDEGTGFSAAPKKRQHGFLDLQSVLHIFLFLVGFVSVFWLCSFVAKKLKKPKGDSAE
ncbi:hypothetical protein GC174_18070 [bacterium]|nr:hypothetical protein [bacterium]